MAFGTATVLSNKGVAVYAARNVGGTPSQPEAKFVAMGVGATGAARTAAVADTALSSEAAEGRTTGTGSTVTTTQTNDTYQVVGTVAATGTRAVDEAGLFDAVSAGNLVISATFAVQNLLNGDSIQFTFKNKFIPG